MSFKTTINEINVFAGVALTKSKSVIEPVVETSSVLKPKVNETPSLLKHKLSEPLKADLVQTNDVNLDLDKEEPINFQNEAEMMKEIQRLRDENKQMKLSLTEKEKVSE